MIARIAQASDIPALIEAWKRFMLEEHEAVPDGDPQAALAGWSARLHSQIARAQVLVLESDTGVAGFAGFIDAADRDWIPKGVAYAVDLYIQPEWRRATAARTLMAALMQTVVDAGYSSIWTNTALSNRRMQVLLKRAGYAPNPGFSIPGLRDQVYVRRDLDAS